MELQNSLVEESPVVTLKNGKSASRVTVKRVMDKMKDMLSIPNGAILLNDLVMKCQNERHQFFDGCAAKLYELGFLDSDGVVFPSMRDIVLSSITGEGQDLGFGSPIMP